MKTEEHETVKKFDSVAFFRKVKADLSKELCGKTFEEQKRIIQQKLSETKKV